MKARKKRRAALPAPSEPQSQLAAPAAAVQPAAPAPPATFAEMVRERLDNQEARYFALLGRVERQERALVAALGHIIVGTAGGKLGIVARKKLADLAAAHAVAT